MSSCYPSLLLCSVRLSVPALCAQTKLIEYKKFCIEWLPPCVPADLFGKCTFSQFLFLVL